MTLKLRHRRVAPKTTLNNNGTVSIEIPQDNPLRRITLNFTQDFNENGTTAGGIDFGFLNILKRIRVVMDGFDNKFDVEGRVYWVANSFQNGTTPFIDNQGVPSTPADTISNLTITIDFAQLKNNLNDFSGLLNAPALSSLDLIIDYGGLTDLLGTAGTSTITSTVDISIDEVYDNGVGENQLPEVVLNAQDFREGLDVERTDAIFNSFGSSEFPVKILPVPSTILEHCLFVQNQATPFAPLNNRLTDLKLENVRGGGELLFIDNFENVRQQGKAEYSLEFGQTDTTYTEAEQLVANPAGSTLQQGAIFISWSELRLEGLLNNVVDALKYKFLISSATATTIKIYKKFLVATASV